MNIRPATHEDDGFLREMLYEAAAWNPDWPRERMIAALASLVVVLLAALYFRAQLGGVTGDTLGAANQMIELACYLVCAGAQQWI